MTTQKPETQTERVGLYLTPTLKAELVRLARQDNRSVNSYVTQLIVRASAKDCQA